MKEAENNKLIAEFMGVESYEANGYTNFVYSENNHRTHVDLAYHTSWDWLMSVTKKCLDVYHIEQMNDDLNFNFYDSIGNMDATYKAVVEFIKQNSNTI